MLQPPANSLWQQQEFKSLRGQPCFAIHRALVPRGWVKPPLIFFSLCPPCWLFLNVDTAEEATTETGNWNPSSLVRGLNIGRQRGRTQQGGNCRETRHPSSFSVNSWAYSKAVHVWIWFHQCSKKIFKNRIYNLIFHITPRFCSRIILSQFARLFNIFFESCWLFCAKIV